MTRFARPMIALAAVAFMAAPRAARAQVPGAELTQVLVSRPALESLATRLEQAANSRNFSSDLRNRSRAQALLVRERLRDGDFQVGDRIMLRVEGESSLSDTFTVRAGRQLLLPGIGALPLEGVLRVELTDYLTQRLGQFLRNPQVRAQGLIRVAVIGGVARQGFYMVPVDIPVDELLSRAGGPVAAAQLDLIRIERGQEVLYSGRDLQAMITQGRTLDALSIRAGDRFVIPVETPKNPYQIVQTIQILLTIPLTLYGLSKLF